MAFIVLGLLVSQTGMLEVPNTKEVLYLIAEIALIILLFLDASQIDLAQLRKQNAWPLRMLLIGLPLSVLIGTLVGYIFFPQWPFAMIALIAAIMAPTDAALGEAVVSNKVVPKNERQTLTVESGLNDGLALPLILFFASFLAMTTAPKDNELEWIIFGASQIFIGILVGLFMGWSSGRLFQFGETRNFTSHVYQGIGVLALTGTSYLVAVILGGNGFISAFLSGLAFGNIVKGRCKFIYEFSESEGQMLVWAAFVVVGLGLLPDALKQLTPATVGYILASMFLVRPLAIYISLIGTKTKLVTRLFLGWFGPRGLATALFALIVSKNIIGDYGNAVLVIALNAVWMSVLLHGFTASIGANWYGKRMKSASAKETE